MFQATTAGWFKQRCCSHKYPLKPMLQSRLSLVRNLCPNEIRYVHLKHSSINVFKEQNLSTQCILFSYLSLLSENLKKIILDFLKSRMVENLRSRRTGKLRLYLLWLLVEAVMTGNKKNNVLFLVQWLNVTFLVKVETTVAFK